MCRFALAWLVAAGAAPAAGAAGARLAVWCEFMPYARVHEHLPTLARHEVDLILHVGRGDIGDPELVRLCRTARDQDVEVMAWFLLPYEKHLYVGEDSLKDVADLSLRFAEWARAEDLGVEWLVFDCEPSPLLGRELYASVRRGRVRALARRLRAERDPARFQVSAAALNGLIGDLRARGFRVMGSANRVLLDMLKHGNTDLQDALNTPFTMIDWDRASFITYRYRASQVQYMAMIRRYARLARGCFGEKAALDLGLLGDQRHFPEHRERAVLFGAEEDFVSYLSGMRSTTDLRDVVSMALGAGVERVNLYSLEGAVDSVAGLDLWLQAAARARPAAGLEAWTPLATARLGAFGFFLHSLYQGLVGGAGQGGEGDR
ncbi:MAG: hypothetical protein JXB04_01695 [Kiritimatiellae bacterium]|nr:hypothetical protein [Kiritimatiellia bacterium]